MAPSRSFMVRIITIMGRQERFGMHLTQTLPSSEAPRRFTPVDIDEPLPAVHINVGPDDVCLDDNALETVHRVSAQLDSFASPASNEELVAARHQIRDLAEQWRRTDEFTSDEMFRSLQSDIRSGWHPYFLPGSGAANLPARRRSTPGADLGRRPFPKLVKHESDRDLTGRWILWTRAAAAQDGVAVTFDPKQQRQLLKTFVTKTLGGGIRAAAEANIILDTLEERIGSAGVVRAEHRLGLDVLQSGDPGYEAARSFVGGNPFRKQLYLFAPQRDAAALEQLLNNTLAYRFFKQAQFIEKLTHGELPLNDQHPMWPSTIRYAEKTAAGQLFEGYINQDTALVSRALHVLHGVARIGNAGAIPTGRSMVEVLAFELGGDAASAEKLLRESIAMVEPEQNKSRSRSPRNIGLER